MLTFKLYLSVCLPACLPAYLPTYLPTYLFVYTSQLCLEQLIQIISLWRTLFYNYVKNRSVLDRVPDKYTAWEVISLPGEGK